MPGRLDAGYIDEHGERKVPVMLHRAILGSVERFIGVLLRALCRRPAAVADAGSGGGDEYHRCPGGLRTPGQRNPAKQGFRVETDLRNEKVGYKIRGRTLEKDSVPGDRG